jgi:hypothetical protein
MEDIRSASVKKTPPYISYATFNTALATLSEHGLPPKLDRSVLKQFSGLNQTLLLSAFRYLGLTNEHDEPTEKFREFVGAESDKRKEILGLLIKVHYPEQVKVLTHGTHQQLKDSFDTTDVPSSVKTKCLSFFLGATKATGYVISNYIVKGMRTRGPRQFPRKPSARASAKTPNGEEASEDTPMLPEGMVAIPIAVGIGKTWQVIVEKNYREDDVNRFVQIIRIALGDGKKG